MQHTYLFEIHLTTNHLSNEQIPLFEKFCLDLDKKAVVIELPIGEHTQQPMMTFTKHAHHIQEVLAYIDGLRPQFLAHHFEIIRTKIEIPASDYHQYYQDFGTTAGYFEWHGKVEFKDNYFLQELREMAHYGGYHLSKNALKHCPNQRFVTYRHDDYDVFVQKVEAIKIAIQNKHVLLDKSKQFGLTLLKSQSEYCVYDDKISLDKGWDTKDLRHSDILQQYQTAYPDQIGVLSDDYSYLEDFCIQEALIRRCAIVNQNFMLKGSHVTRQYFDNPNDRMPYDLDFVCLTPLPDSQTAEQVLNDWLIAVTRCQVHDGVYFVDFAENAFWRKIDYAMHDDFPTVMTDIQCYINGKCYEILLDVSFNLPIPFKPVPLLIKTPIDEFIYPKTVPLSLQIAWKIHQSLVRPRLKDIYDLTHLVKRVHDQKTIDDTITALLQECQKDNISPDKIKQFFSYDFWALGIHFDKDLLQACQQNMQLAGFVLSNLNLQIAPSETTHKETVSPQPTNPKTFWQKIKGIVQ